MNVDVLTTNDEEANITAPARSMVVDARSVNHG
jgi:hypothetical protein